MFTIHTYGYVYILECNDGTYYTGCTKYITHRVLQHKSGEGAIYTSKRLPVKLLYYERYKHIGLAFKREKQIQGWSHQKKKALIEGQLNKLHKLAECNNISHFNLKDYRKESE